MTASKWKWARDTSGTKLYDIGQLADGSLHNPNGYPETQVREAIAAAVERRRVRRSDAAKKAAVTRRDRQDKRLYLIARLILSGSQITPRINCGLCGRRLSDDASIGRGIGSECWDGVLTAIQELQAKAAAAA